MQTAAEQGMRLMDRDLERLVRSGVVDPDDALLKAIDKLAFASLLESLKSPSLAPPGASGAPGAPGAPSVAPGGLRTGSYSRSSRGETG